MFFIVQRRWRVFFYLIAETPPRSNLRLAGILCFTTCHEVVRRQQAHTCTRQVKESLEGFILHLHSGCAQISISLHSLICAHSIINKKYHLQLRGIGPLADPNSHPSAIRAKFLKSFHNYRLNGIINVMVRVSPQPILSHRSKHALRRIPQCNGNKTFGQVLQVVILTQIHINHLGLDYRSCTSNSCCPQRCHYSFFFCRGPCFGRKQSRERFDFYIPSQRHIVSEFKD